MQKFLLVLFLLILNLQSYSQKNPVPSQKELENGLGSMINIIRDNYSYFQEKDVDIECLRASYLKKIKDVKTHDDLILFLELLLNEFYDSHLIINKNIKASYRLHAPVYAKTENGKTFITDVWYSNIKNLKTNIIGAEILEFNGIVFSKAINSFPTLCSNKNNDEVRNWIGNKILAGKYNRPRKLKVKLRNGEIKSINLDNLKIIKSKKALSVKKIDNIGLIRINNSLNDQALISKFDKALNSLMDTDGLILDLRNTISGGRCDVAIGIIGRFINETRTYQKLIPSQRPDGQLQPDKNCMYVDPRLKTYKKPVVVLVGRWTGSMGEGIAIGFDGLKRAEVVGTEMNKLLGNMYGYSILNTDIRYSISMEKVYHINGTSRKDYVPGVLVKPTDIDSDIILKKGIELIQHK